MQKDIVAEVLKHPKYHELVQRRTRLSNLFFGIALALYASFILTLAYMPHMFARPVAAGWTMSIGVLLGVLIIVVAVIMIAIYVYFSNKVFDPLLDQVVRDVE